MTTDSNEAPGTRNRRRRGCDKLPLRGGLCPERYLGHQQRPHGVGPVRPYHLLRVHRLQRHLGIDACIVYQQVQARALQLPLHDLRCISNS